MAKTKLQPPLLPSQAEAAPAPLPLPFWWDSSSWSGSWASAGAQGSLRLQYGGGGWDWEVLLAEVGVTGAELHGALTAGSGSCCSRWGRKAVDTLEV